MTQFFERRHLDRLQVTHNAISLVIQLLIKQENSVTEDVAYLQYNQLDMRIFLVGKKKLQQTRNLCRSSNCSLFFENEILENMTTCIQNLTRYRCGH